MSVIIEELDWYIEADEWAGAAPRDPKKSQLDLPAMTAEYLARGGEITVCPPSISHEYTHRETLNSLFDSQNVTWSLTDRFTAEQREAHGTRRASRRAAERTAADAKDVARMTVALDAGIDTRAALGAHLGLSNDKTVRLLRLYFSDDPRTEGMHRVDRDVKQAQRESKWVKKIAAEFEKGDLPNKTALLKRVGGGLVDATLQRLLRVYFPKHPMAIQLREGGAAWSAMWMKRKTLAAEQLIAAGKNSRKDLARALGKSDSVDLDKFIALTGLPFVNKRRIGLPGTTA